VEKGSKNVGFSINKDYVALYVFPLGIELFAIAEDIEIGITIWPVKLTFCIGRNRTLFS